MKSAFTVLMGLRAQWGCSRRAESVTECADTNIGAATAFPPDLPIFK
jgi:hypothetical protein